MLKSLFSKENLKLYQEVFDNLELKAEKLIRQRYQENGQPFAKDFAIDKILIAEGEMKVLVFYTEFKDTNCEILTIEDLISC